MRTLKWTLFLSLFGVFLLVASWTAGRGGNETDILIPRGAPIKKVATLLQEQGVISHPFLFKILVYVTGGSHRLRAGEYAFRQDMGTLNALGLLYFGDPIEHTVTVPEGWNIHQIAEALAAKKLVDPEVFMRFALSPKAAQKYQLKSPSLEGFLYPDTYTFSRIDGEGKILDRMVQRFFSKVDNRLIEKARQMGMSLEQLVTLASIIEKETGASSERQLISSVFHNRLKKRMRLQSDPTTIYGIKNFNGNLTKKDLLTKTPYNTYTIQGLPPGAIANPGLSAIEAAVNPADTRYLYFVSNNQGAHLFSETYAQHNQHVDHYQKARHKPRRANSTRQIGTLRKRSR